MLSLDEIGVKHRCDKSSIHHGYCEVYSRYFEPLRNDPITLLEIGFGGYEYPDRGGAGAKMWAEYFPNAQIITVDINHKNPLNHPRIHFYQGSQTNEQFLYETMTKHYWPMVIIDDGSHRVQDVIATFGFLFQHLRSGGIYVVEDVESSYSDQWGYGGNPVPGRGETTMSYFKRLTDQLNCEFFTSEHHNMYSGKIEFVHFYRNLVIIKKK